MDNSGQIRTNIVQNKGKRVQDILTKEILDIWILRAGHHMTTSFIYEDLVNSIVKLLSRVLGDATVLATHSKHMRIYVKDIIKALKKNNLKIYGYDDKCFIDNEEFHLAELCSIPNIYNGLQDEDESKDVKILPQLVDTFEKSHPSANDDLFESSESELSADSAPTSDDDEANDSDASSIDNNPVKERIRYSIKKENPEDRYKRILQDLDNAQFAVSDYMTTQENGDDDEKCFADGTYSDDELEKKDLSLPCPDLLKGITDQEAEDTLLKVSPLVLSRKRFVTLIQLVQQSNPYKLCLPISKISLSALHYAMESYIQGILATPKEQLGWKLCSSVYLEQVNQMEKVLKELKGKLNSTNELLQKTMGEKRKLEEEISDPTILTSKKVKTTSTDVTSDDKGKENNKAFGGLGSIRARFSSITKKVKPF